MPDTSRYHDGSSRQRRHHNSDSESDDRSVNHRHRNGSGHRREERRRRDRSREYHHNMKEDESRYRRRRSQDRTYRDRSSSPKRSKRSPEPSRPSSPARRSSAPLPTQNESFQGDVARPGESAPRKQKPNFKPTGLLAKEANTVVGTSTVLKYHEPPEARKPPPSQQWRMYVFKQKDLLDTIYLFNRSCWLFGRDQHVTDLLLEHPSISKQHAVIQFRHQTVTNEFGDKTNKVKPYVIDLDSANGTRLNGKRMDESRYVELVDGDVVVFGDSEREYVMMLPAPDKK